MFLHLDQSNLFLVYVSDEFVILHSPDSVEFIVNGPIEQSSLKEVMCMALGFTRKQVCYLSFFNGTVELQIFWCYKTLKVF